MIHLFFYLLIFLLLAEGETVFLRALPYPFIFAPLVFSVGLYLYQHLSLSVGLWWLLVFGFFLDFWRIGSVPGESFFYALTVGATIFLSRRFFTNRSFYGVNACVFLSGLILHLTHGLYLFFKTLGNPEIIVWSEFFQTVFWSEFFSLLIVSFLFLFLGRLRIMIFHFLINKSS